MKLNSFTKRLSLLGRWVATVLFCVSAIAFIWQGSFFSNTVALAADRQVQEARDEVAGKSKNFVRDAADTVKKAASDNASRVDNATDSGSPIEGKAKRDRNRIQKRADEDAARTQEAIENNTNAVERAVEGIKDAFGG